VESIQELIPQADSDSDSDTDSIDTGIDTLGIVDHTGLISFFVGISAIGKVVM